MRRRIFIKSLLASTLSGASFGSVGQPSQPHVAVVGAGVFGGWTALFLQRAGARVSLIDAWGPGHSRSSSGGESRVIRHAYGKRLYVDMAQRSLALWQEASAAWGRPLLHISGVLHMLEEGSPLASLVLNTDLLTDAGVPHELLEHYELVRRYQQINMDGVQAALFEPTAGYLLARRACEAVLEAFLDEGGTYHTAWVQPGPIASGRMDGIKLSIGGTLSADRYVFACGPWLKTLFPDVVGPHLGISRQEMFYFGTPPGDHRYDAGALPVWTNFGDRIWYGIPGGEQRGFKIADDTHGPAHDPSSSERRVTQQGIDAARDFLQLRFPGLGEAPLIEARVCQYSNTPDGDFIADRHPAAENTWILGGGSGHGFKHGPAFGEMVAGQVLEERPPEATFALGRFGQ